MTKIYELWKGSWDDNNIPFPEQLNLFRNSTSKRENNDV